MIQDLKTDRQRNNRVKGIKVNVQTAQTLGVILLHGGKHDGTKARHDAAKARRSRKQQKAARRRAR